MISKVAIENFLEKKVDNCSWIKEISKKRIEEELYKELSCRFKTEPYLHQLACILLGMYNNDFLFFLEQGLGKTKIVLDVLSNKTKYWNRALIVSPNASTVFTWENEIKRHSNFKYVELLGPTHKRWVDLDKDGELLLINYTGLLVMLSESVNGKWLINSKKVKALAEYFDAIIFDEIHNAKNPKSLTFKVLKTLSRRCNLRYGLTGTPLNRDPLSLWSQFYLVDRGETLSDNLYLYREAFFTARKNYWGGTDFKFKKNLQDNLFEKLGNKSIRYSGEEALELPEITFITVPIELHEEAQGYYYPEFVGFEDKTTLDMKISFMKLRQICSGFLGFKNEDEETVKIEFDTNKLEALVEITKDTPDDSQVLVFLDFIKSGEMVAEKLKKEKISFERLYGGTKDKPEAIKKFTKGKVKVLVANTKSGSAGLNLQNANYIIFYELPISGIDYQQSVKRVHRTGQTKKCFIYEFITKGSVEERIKEFLTEGRDVFKALIDGIKKGKK